MRDEPIYLGEFEQLVLMAVLRLGDAAYGLAVRDEIARRAGRDVSRGAVYITLDRLEQKRLLSSRLADAAADRGGRPRRYYALESTGLAALQDSMAAIERMAKGLHPWLRKA